MSTLKLVIKHAGSSLVSTLMSYDTVEQREHLVDGLVGMWRDLPVEKDTKWYFRDGLYQRDITTVPGEGEHHWLFRFTFIE